MLPWDMSPATHFTPDRRLHFRKIAGKRHHARMSLTTFKIGKKEFVVLPRRRFDQLTRAERDQKGAEIARKGREAYLAGSAARSA